ncbi:MAG: hypothetical protein LBN21_04150 [Treponema sp.]|nr:hypothetical protein [Treponema sp.]
MKLLTVDSIEEARIKLLNCMKDRAPVTDRINSPDALGRILAEDISADGDIPNFRRSTVDGYAVVSADTAGAGEAIPVFLKCAGSVEMGKAAGFSLHRGECALVPTGGMIPDGADAVVMVEYTEKAGDNSTAVYQSAAVGSNIAEAGEDLRNGEIFLHRGACIRFQEIGALAAAGITTIPVYAPLRITLVSTGDELIPPSAAPETGEVRDINSWALCALAARNGYQVMSQKRIGDDEALLERAVRESLASSDVVAVSGGSSQGEKDATARIFSRIAKPGIFTHGLAVKPGKPTILGFDEVTQTILAGLPGHPVSAMMVFEILFSWLARKLTHQSEPVPIPAKVPCNIPGAPGKTLYQPALLRSDDNAPFAYIAEPVFGKSGMISTLTRAGGYIIIDKNKEGLKKDEDVWVYLM